MSGYLHFLTKKQLLSGPQTFVLTLPTPFSYYCKHKCTQLHTQFMHKSTQTNIFMTDVINKTTACHNI